MLSPGFTNANLKVYSKTVEPGYLKLSPFLTTLDKMNCIRRGVKGTSITKDYHVRETSGFKSIGAYAILDRKADEDEVRAEWTWGAYHGQEIFDGLERDRLGGESQIRDAEADYVEKLRVDVEQRFQEELWNGTGAPVGTNPSGPGIIGILQAIVASPSTGVYAGLSRATYAFWRNQAVDCQGGPNVDFRLDAAERIHRGRADSDRPFKGGKRRADMLFCTRDNDHIISTALEARNNAITSDIGDDYSVWGFRKTIDDNVPASGMLMLNSSTIKVLTPQDTLIEFTTRSGGNDRHPRTIVYDAIMQCIVQVEMPRNNTYFSNAEE